MNTIVTPSSVQRVRGMGQSAIASAVVISAVRMSQMATRNIATPCDMRGSAIVSRPKATQAAPWPTNTGQARKVRREAAPTYTSYAPESATSAPATAIEVGSGDLGPVDGRDTELREDEAAHEL